MKKIINILLSFACMLAIMVVAVHAENDNDKNSNTNVPTISISEATTFDEMVATYAQNNQISTQEA